MQGAPSEVATAQYQCVQQTEPRQAAAPLKRLRHGSVLHGAKSVKSTVLGLPPALQSNAFYIPAAEAASLLQVQVHVPAKAYILVPALQQLPFCMYEDWKPVEGSHIKVHWSGFNWKQRVWLNVMNKRQSYTDQPLLLYKFTGRGGLLLNDEVLQLPLQHCYPAGSASSAALCFQPILCLRPTTGHAAANMSMSGDGSSGCLDRQALLEPADYAACSMQLIQRNLELGILNVAELTQSQANTILQRVMAAADDELLLMLVDAEICMCCSMPCLEQLLEYAKKRNFPYLAELVLTKAKVELTQPLLAWLVHALVASKGLTEAEHLLSSYIINRRNPLSAVAAVEHALFKAATPGLAKDMDAMQLATQFRTAKHTLLQQLIQQSDEGQQAVIWAGQAAHSASTGGCGASVFERRDNMFSFQVDSLLYTINLCMQEFSMPVLGRGGGSGRASIHDSSPYRLSLEPRDAAFFSIPKIMDYTRLVWFGRDLHTMSTLLLLQQEKAAYNALSTFASKRLPNTDMLGDSNIAGRSLISNQTAASIAAQAQLQCSGMNNTSIACSRPGPCTEGMERRMDAFSSSHNVQGRITKYCDGSRASSCKDATHRSGRCATSVNDAAIGSARRSTGNSAQVWSGDSETKRPWMQMDYGYEIMQNIGLAGGSIGASLARFGCMSVYGLLMTPRGMVNSPRGWWMGQLASEIIFLYTYMLIVLTSSYINVYGIMILLVGNLVNIGFQVCYKYSGSFTLYLKDHWNKLDITMSLGLTAATLLYIQSIMLNPQQLSLKAQPTRQDAQAEQVVASAFAVLVWSRALMLLSPMSSKLGAILYTLRRAAGEAAVMVPVLFVLLVGFGATLTVVYKSTLTQYSSLLGSIRTLVGITGSDVRLSDFETEAAKTAAANSNSFLLVYGQVVVILYIVLVNILIMTLLIAMINHTYQPEVVKSQAVVMQAASVFDYEWHVLYGLSCTPSTIMQLMLCWLPRGYRSRAVPSACLRWGIPPLDGYVPESIAGAPAMLIPTGPAEICNLAFLLTSYPMTAVAGVLLLILHVPAGVLHFVLDGHKLWWDSPWDQLGIVLTNDEQPVAAAGHIVQRCSSWVGQQLLKVLNIAFALVTGLLAQIVLIVVSSLLLLWAFITRVLYSLYCIYVPAAANSNCCLKLTRSADFWSEEAVYAAFEAAGITVMSASSSGNHSQHRQSKENALDSSAYSAHHKSFARSQVMRSAQSTSKLSSSTTASTTLAIPAHEQTGRSVTVNQAAQAAGSMNLGNIQFLLPDPQFPGRPALGQGPSFHAEADGSVNIESGAHNNDSMGSFLHGYKRSNCASSKDGTPSSSKMT